MQLLHPHLDRSQQTEIHIIYRERPPATYVHENEPQPSWPIAPLVSGCDVDRRESLSSPPPLVHPYTNASPTPHARISHPFGDTPDHGGTMATEIPETLPDSPQISRSNIEPSQQGLQANLDSFVDHDEYHDSPYDNLTSHGYNSTFQSTFRSLIGLPQELEEPPSVHPEVAVEQPIVLPATDMAYPEYIHDTLAFILDQPLARKNYYPLWNYVLEYWFPSTQGFEILQDWDPKGPLRAHQVLLNDMGGESSSSTPKQSFAVFDITSPTEPFLFVNVHNALAVNDFTRRQARITMNEAFETLQTCSFCAGFESLCVISAVGAKWGMALRETGWLDSDFDGGCVGDWEEDVTTTDSFDVMRYYFEGMKNSIQRRRNC